MSAVRYEHATRTYEGSDVPAVDDLDLDVGDGELIVLVGPSGSGKTTALRMLAGLEPLDAGAVHIGERDVTNVRPRDRDIAMVFQNYALYPHMTVRENMGFALELQRKPKAEIDGASLKGQLTSIILPMAAPGIAATALLCVIFAWNEFFYAVQLNPVKGSTVPIWVTTNISTRGDFLAKLSAASVLACIPVVLAGWIAQKRMIRGLAMGAIK